MTRASPSQRLVSAADVIYYAPLPVTLGRRSQEGRLGVCPQGLVLLRHSFCLTVCSGGRPQQGHRGRTSTSVCARRIRSVAMEFGMWL